MCSTPNLHLTWQYSICSEQWHFALPHLSIAYCAYFITVIKFEKRCLHNVNAVLKLKHHTRREPVLLISIHFAFVFCWNCLMLNGITNLKWYHYTFQTAALYFSFISLIMKLIFINHLLPLQVIIHPNLCPDTEECSVKNRHGWTLDP